MKKFSKIGKRLVALFLVAFMNINTFAAVSGNDGSAFVTKSEFDALVNTFNEQMDNYEKSLVSKIDGAIANYLASLSNRKHVSIVTGIEIEVGNIGTSGKFLNMIKSNSNFWSMSNTPRGEDYIWTSALGTYRKLAAYEQDTYDTLVYQSAGYDGSTSSLLTLVDSNSLVSLFKTNPKVVINRNVVFYSTTDANNGLNWTTVKSQYNVPTSLYSNSSIFQNSITATGRAFKRTSSATAPDSVHTRQASSRTYAQNNCDATTGNTDNYERKSTFDYIYYTADNHNQALTYLKRSTIVSFSGTDIVSYVPHWPLGSSYKLKTSVEEWGTVAMIDKANTSFKAYNNNVKLRYASGPGAYNSIWPTLTTQGYGVKFKTTDKAVTDVYYSKLYDSWNKKIKYGGGFPLFYLEAEEEATITIPIKLGNQATIAITNTQKTTFPTEGSDDIISLQYRPVGGNWVNAGKKPVLLGGSEFELKFNMTKGQVAYLIAKWDTADNALSIRQTAKAYMDTDE